MKIMSLSAKVENICPGCEYLIEDVEFSDPQYECVDVDGQRWHKRCLEKSHRIQGRQAEQDADNDLQQESSASGEMKKIAGEDWFVSDSVIAIISDIIDEIKRRGGLAFEVGVNKIDVESFVLDPSHSVPLKIQIYEGTYHPGKAIVNATFGDDMPLPVRDRQPFEAKAIVDAVADGFMSLVNYKKDNTRTAAKKRPVDDTPYKNLVETFVKLGRDDYDNLVKAGVIVDGKVVEGWPKPGSFHGTLGYENRGEVEELIAWMTEGGIDHDMRLMIDADLVFDSVNALLRKRGLTRRVPGTTQRQGLAKGRRPEPKTSMLDIIRERMQGMKTALPAHDATLEEEAIPMESEPTGEEARVAKSLWQMPRFAAPISLGFRVCRKCGKSVGNEFVFHGNGMMCDKCRSQIKKAGLPTAQVIPDDGITDGGTPYTDEEMDLMEGKPDPKASQLSDDRTTRRRFVHIHFDDGDVIKTTINGTKDEVELYYLGQDFEKSDETTHRAIKVEFIQ